MLTVETHLGLAGGPLRGLGGAGADERLNRMETALAEIGGMMRRLKEGQMAAAASAASSAAAAAARESEGGSPDNPRRRVSFDASAPTEVVRGSGGGGGGRRPTVGAGESEGFFGRVFGAGRKASAVTPSSAAPAAAKAAASPDLTA